MSQEQRKQGYPKPKTTIPKSDPLHEAFIEKYLGPEAFAALRLLFSITTRGDKMDRGVYNPWFLIQCIYEIKYFYPLILQYGREIVALYAVSYTHLRAHET